MSAVCLALLWLAAGTTEPEPRYVFINKAPGAEGWSAGVPESFARAGFDEITRAIDPPDNPALRLGISFVFDFFRYDPQTLGRSLDRFLELSEETGVPILVNLDGMNWWGNRPDLWNWWDPTKPGYDPENRRNVEWCGWGPEHAVKIGWRNWGSQIRVLPMMNVASPQVIAAHQDVLRILLPRIATWWKQLPHEKRYLLGGVKLGHEASIGINAWYYPNGNQLAERPTTEDPLYGLKFAQGWHGGVQPIGYAAVATAGIKQTGELNRDDIAHVTQSYLALLCAEAHTAGLPADKVYTHQGGTYHPWEKSLPWWPAFNADATPGWSLYFTDPAEATGLGDTLDGQGTGRWAAVEWWWQGNDEAGWRNHFERTLAFRNCQFLVIYNWNCGLSFSKHPAGLHALQTLLRDWKGLPPRTATVPQN
ncbi:MAG: hypothetical protein ACYC0X_00905 [Pirellulaceae bacterium]